jgi:5'-3' exonuclease
MKRVAIDALNLLYAVAHQLTDIVGQDLAEPLAAATLKRILVIEEHFVAKAILVLDGEAPKPKAPVIQERAQKRTVAQEEVRSVIQAEVQRARIQHEASGSPAPFVAPTPLQVVHCLPAPQRMQVEEAAHRALHVTRGLRRRVFEVLVKFGVEVFQAPGEAEAQCGYWAHQGWVEIVVTRDFDAFLHGAPRVCLNVMDIERITTLEQVLRECGAASRQDLIEACVLSGRTDYAPRLFVKGPLQHAVHILRHGGGFNNIVNRQPEAQRRAWIEARRLMFNPRICTCPIGRPCACIVTVNQRGPPPASPPLSLAPVVAHRAAPAYEAQPLATPVATLLHELPVAA